MRVLVTGATGLTGRHVVERLLSRGDTVRALVLPETLERMRYRDQLEALMGSLADKDVLERATKNVEVVYHLAQLAPVPGRKLSDLIETNVKGTENLLRACEEAGKVRRFVFNSSVQVYTPHPSPHMWPIREDAGRMAHGSEHMKNYGQTKIDAEDLVREYQRRAGFEYVILRPTTSYGPGDRALEQLLLQMTKHPHLVAAYSAQWGGMQWVYVGDLADAIVLAGTKAKAANEVFTIAGGELMTARSLAATVQQIKQDARPSQRAAFRGNHGNLLLKRYDLTKAQRLLGYVPQVTLKEGLEKSLAVMDHHKLWMAGQESGSARGGFGLHARRHAVGPPARQAFAGEERAAGHPAQLAVGPRRKPRR
jgi:nucleoside-diphosphate-sugar epimerase